MRVFFFSNRGAAMGVVGATIASTTGVGHRHMELLNKLVASFERF